jgi:hypothetical protein
MSAAELKLPGRECPLMQLMHADFPVFFWFSFGATSRWKWLEQIGDDSLHSRVSASEHVPRKSNTTSTARTRMHADAANEDTDFLVFFLVLLWCNFPLEMARTNRR